MEEKEGGLRGGGGGGQEAETKKPAPVLREVLPKCGLIYSEKGNLSEVLCKPKILPIKSARMQKLEELIQKAMEPPASNEDKTFEEEESPRAAGLYAL